MNINEIAQILESKSIFDLWCIYCLADNLMHDDAKNRAVKRQLKIGDNLTYFDKSENRLVEAVILEIRKNRVLVKNNHDYKTWLLPFHMINLDNIANITENLKSVGISKANLKINDHVGWNSRRMDRELFGTVVKLNPKKAVILLADGQVWNVPYDMLFPVMDAQARAVNDKFLIIDCEATVVN